MSKGRVLFCAPRMHILAGHIIEEQKGKSSLANLSWGSFPDGFPDLFIQDVDSIRGKRTVFLADFHTPADIFQQLSAIYALPRYCIKNMLLILPYFPTGTMERIDSEGQVATAKTLSRMLSAVPLTSKGPVKLIIFDIHALQERFYFDDSVLPLCLSAIPWFVDHLRSHPEEYPENQISIAFPDDGACKRFERFFKGYDIIVCSKVRVGKERLITIKEGEPGGKHVIIVDDLVQSGGTILSCEKVLKKAGAIRVSAYVTHAIFPGDSWRNFLDSGFHRFFVTDSCPLTVQKLEGQGPFIVLPLAPVISAAIDKYM